MLSGFFGLIAIETSAGLIALGSVMRTTCCAEVVAEKMTSSAASLVQGFMSDVITGFSGFRYNSHTKNEHSFKQSFEERLEGISWDEFFRGFDRNKLAFLYQEKTKGGKL